METQIEVFVGVDMAKGDHYAQAVMVGRSELFDRSVLNDEAAINLLIDDASVHGQIALVIDMTAASAQLLLSIAHHKGVPGDDPPVQRVGDEFAGPSVRVGTQR